MQFQSRLGAMLSDSELVYAGQGYCFAFARFADESAVGSLVAYLDRYLPDLACHYDQAWAMGALLHLDERLQTDHAGHFLAPGNLWARSAMADRDPAELGLVGRADAVAQGRVQLVGVVGEALDLLYREAVRARLGQ